MKNKIDDLRNHLFAALEGLSDREKPMEIDRALAIAEVAQVVINSAKVEVEFLKLHNTPVKSTDFIPVAPVEPVPPRNRIGNGAHAGNGNGAVR